MTTGTRWRKSPKAFELTLTDDSEVEGGLTEAVAVPQLDGVAAAVLLLPAADGQFTADVTALNGDIF